jgi:hypothetical protein
LDRQRRTKRRLRDAAIPNHVTSLGGETVWIVNPASMADATPAAIANHSAMPSVEASWVVDAPTDPERGASATSELDHGPVAAVVGTVDAARADDVAHCQALSDPHEPDADPSRVAGDPNGPCVGSSAALAIAEDPNVHTSLGLTIQTTTAVGAFAVLAIDAGPRRGFPGRQPATRPEIDASCCVEHRRASDLLASGRLVLAEALPSMLHGASTHREALPSMLHGASTHHEAPTPRLCGARTMRGCACRHQRIGRPAANRGKSSGLNH